MATVFHEPMLPLLRVDIHKE